MSEGNLGNILLALGYVLRKKENIKEEERQSMKCGRHTNRGRVKVVKES
jgi:hypothetical protein